jgi:hypothetical protein
MLFPPQVVERIVVPMAVTYVGDADLVPEVGLEEGLEKTEGPLACIAGSQVMVLEEALVPGLRGEDVGPADAGAVAMGFAVTVTLTVRRESELSTATRP